MAPREGSFSLEGEFFKLNLIGDMETISADELKNQILEVISRSTKDLQQFRITSPEGTVVLLPEEMYDRLVVTLELLSTPGLLEMMESKDPDKSNILTLSAIS